MSLKVLITGANRGIGLGLTKKFLRSGHSVIATTRNPDGSRELWEVEHEFGNRCQILEIDVTDATSLKNAAAKILGQGLDILINNSGYSPPQNGAFIDVPVEQLSKTLAINSLGPLRTTQTFLPHLRLGQRKIVATISSKMGSIADNTSGGYYAYRMSKAAANMFNRSFAIDHPDIIAVVLHPGWVKTDMGGSKAPLSVEDSAADLYQVIMGLTPEQSGQFLNYDGKPLPW